MVCVLCYIIICSKTWATTNARYDLAGVIMILVVIALLPLYIFGAINIGFQNSIAIDLERSNWENFWFGFNKILPIIIVTFASGAFWELLFAVVRKHPVSEGFLVTCALIP